MWVCILERGRERGRKPKQVHLGSFLEKWPGLPIMPCGEAKSLPCQSPCRSRPEPRPAPEPQAGEDVLTGTLIQQLCIAVLHYPGPSWARWGRGTDEALKL